MTTGRTAGVLNLVVLIATMQASDLFGQAGRRLGERRGGEITYEPRGPGVIFDALDPALRKWYVPQELYELYGWQQWQYSNYARTPYQRYVGTDREGDPFYDLYGNYLTRGWLIWDWNQSQPGQFGSSLYKDPRFAGWFSSVLVSSDSRGQFHYAITAGNQIRTALTPLTFSKPIFNGLQMDLATDKYRGTLLFSRISSPVASTTSSREPMTVTNATNLMGGRVVAEVGDFVQVGATLVNAHNSQTFEDAFERNPLKGALAANQGAVPVRGLALVLSDDSPEDGVAGAALFSHEIVVTTEDPATGRRQEIRQRAMTTDPARWPVVSGGFHHEGFQSADGDEKIVISYDLNDISYTGPRPGTITRITFELVVANDYRIQVWSDRQTGLRPTPNLPLSGEDIDELAPALFEVARAAGNVSDNSNQTRLVFEYGLPTANMVYGFTVDVKEVMGFDAYAELAVNRSWHQFPNPGLAQADRALSDHSRDGEAWMVNVSRVAWPFFAFGEAFSLDPDYSTTAYLVDGEGDVLYDHTTRHLYEFVDDNDDQDRFPDWSRWQQGSGDANVFPGWDENNDFVSDFNQNDSNILSNRIPDYEEPFFRYHSDRPEFLFGIDLNNNHWVDRFENDDLADYPYRRDQRGYNVYGGLFATPGIKATLGRMRVAALSSDRRNHTTYGLVTVTHDDPRFGRIRIYDMLKRTRDTIPDDRREMTPYLGLATGNLINIEDQLPARDTWVNSAYLELSYRPLGGLKTLARLKYDLYAQQGDAHERGVGPVLEDRTHFFGIINKADYTWRARSLEVQPRIKSEYLNQTPFILDGDERREWTGTGILLLRHPMLGASSLEAGLEYHRVADLMLNEKEALAANRVGATGDSRSLVLAAQWSTVGEYQGYTLITRFGIMYTRVWDEFITAGGLGASVKEDRGRELSTTFITMNAGL
ncbi:MAG: hypothetical protein OXG13_03420 [Gemmatimonadaceae bacterium]|nr:hypothetical protein [Gemmatimonadaceae bacterium]